MKKTLSVFLAALFLGGVTISHTSCFGKFALTRKVYEFNKGLGNRVIQQLAFMLMQIIPVYGVAGFIDLFVFNLIEFWTGNNILAMKPGEVKQQYAMYNGKQVLLTATQGRMTIVEQSCTPSINIELVWNEANQAWDTYSNGHLTHTVQFVDANGDVASTPSSRVTANISPSTQLFALAPAAK